LPALPRDIDRQINGKAGFFATKTSAIREMLPDSGKRHQKIACLF
jgi:hypothetical protein